MNWAPPMNIIIPMNNKYIRSTLVLLLTFIAFSLIAAEPPFAKKKKSYKIPSYSSNVILDRICDLEMQVDFRLNGKVKAHILEYTTRGKRGTEKILGLSTRFFPAFEYYNDHYNLPDELKSLMIIESGLNPMVSSSTGARGLWQLMPATARSYGLQINDYVDERCDPYKSTEAALKHLGVLFEQFDDWTLAIAAYNCGSTRVRAAIKKGKSKNFWKIKKHLPKQTQDYIQKFIAVNYLVNYYMFYDLRPQYPDYTFQLTEPIVIFSYDKLSRISEKQGIELDILYKLNPSYINGIVPPNEEGNIVLLPVLGRKDIKQTASLFENSKDQL